MTDHAARPDHRASALMRASVLSPDPALAPVRAARWPMPEPPPGWALVRVVRAALNRLDEMTVAHRLALPGDAVIGSDAAGVVVAVADGDDRFVVGDHVVLLPSLWWGPDDAVQGPDMEILGYPVQGTHAEYVTVPADNLYRKPDRLSWDHAAALPLAGVTAWRALVTRGRLLAGETVVITAASSGVGSIAIQIAASLGARVVAVTGSDAKLAEAVRLGAESGVLRTTAALAQALEEATSGGADLVVDSTGANWPALMAALKPGGRLVGLGKKAADTGHVPVQALYWKQVDVLGSSMGSPRDFAALLEHVSRAAWQPTIDSVFDLDDVVDAYQRLEAPDRFGKVLLSAGQA